MRVSTVPVTAIMVAAMIVIVASANFLVRFPVNDWLTWGAITYPLSYFVTDLTNRLRGPREARKVVWTGFALAVIVSAWLAGPRIAAASGTAFLVSQLLDIRVFDRLRRRGWWQPPLYSSTIGSAVDTALFFALAFYATDMPWVTLAIGDYGVKLAIALIMLGPWWLVARRPPSGSGPGSGPAGVR
ncbi:MAG: queuosine precursor transporter [Wenzhouxiangellaceae bacterium]|nr:queuosine precursor transporter [Wenzhouxiangellaceae bacterium]